MVALAEAVDTIHRAGVTHRDLKPGNVLLAEDQPVVVDFGVATATEATSITVVGTVMGSPGWMAPEQVTGGAPSPAMDVFAWGTLVAWAATGRNPFGTGRPEAVAYRIIHDEPDLEGVPADVGRSWPTPWPRSRRPDPPPPQLLARLLGSGPAGSPDELAADATALLARTWVQTPVQPPQPTTALRRSAADRRRDRPDRGRARRTVAVRPRPPRWAPRRGWGSASASRPTATARTASRPPRRTPAGHTDDDHDDDHDPDPALPRALGDRRRRHPGRRRRLRGRPRPTTPTATLEVQDTGRRGPGRPDRGR